VTREGAEDAVESLGVRAGLLGELTHRAGSARERSRNVEVGDDAESLRRHRAAQQVPETFLWRNVTHDRAAATAAATSSTSASISVRQSSSVRPSRTTAMTGGSASRSRSASSSSTAQAKLGSSVTGNDPPPARATVSSTW